MAAPAHKTLFEILGVHPEATDDEVERAYADFHFGLDRVIPSDVTEAYRFLQDAERRDWYRELLRACQKDELLLIPPDQYNGFKSVCDLTQITLYRHPTAENSYAVRLPGQAQPRWTADRRPVGESGPRVPPFRERLWNLFESVVLLGALRRASLGEKFALVLLYCLVIAAVAYGARWAAREIAIVRGQDLAATVKSRHAEAIDKLARLEAASKAVDSDFTTATGATFDPESGRPVKPKPEVNDAILRHSTVRDAWAAFESGRVKPSEFQRTHESLSAIGERIKNQTYVSEDRDRLNDLVGWIDKSASQLASQSRYIKHIKTMVETDQFERSGHSAERTGP